MEHEANVITILSLLAKAAQLEHLNPTDRDVLGKNIEALIGPAQNDPFSERY